MRQTLGKLRKNTGVEKISEEKTDGPKQRILNNRGSLFRHVVDKCGITTGLNRNLCL